MRITDTSDLWWKNAVIYCLDVENYLDDDGDGVGDFAGLARRIDYLADLGVTCLWLMPFYPSPGRDDGYDVADFYGVDPRLGTLGDFVEVVRTARDRGIRVMIDLVVNHTSDKHPWFRESRKSVDNPYRDFYLWRKEKPKENGPTIFPGEEASMWEFDEKTGEYFLHSFYRHQPDLNMANPKVRDEIAKVIGFWLELGICGFRVDAVPYLVEPKEESPLGDSHEFLRDLRRFLQRRSSEAIMLGEANLPYEEQLEYFGGPEGSELSMQFDFLANQAMYLALARRDPAPLVEMLQRRPEIARESQFANFVRNHDELTLDKLSGGEREEVFAAFGPEERHRIYDRGIRRRLPGMLQGDPRRLEMVYSLLLSLPGTPVLFYGEEIGMGENLDLHGRTSVRTPMQWDATRNGGFSTARPSHLVAAPPSDGYAPAHVNVIAQRSDEGSLLQHVRRLIMRRRASAEIGWGEFEVLDQDQPSVLAHSMRNGLGRFVALHNFAEHPVTVTLTLRDEDHDVVLVDLLGPERIPLDASSVSFELDAYGYRWLRVGRPGDGRLG